MTISGKSLIAGQWLGDNSAGFTAINAATNENMAQVFAETSLQELNKAIVSADQAFVSYSQLPAEKRADFLTAIGEQIIALGDELISTACAETGLPEARITGERGRTVGQLNLFADLLRAGEYQAVVEQGNPTREPLPKPDTRLGYVALGAVAVFGASNFPLAFSTAGGDTASALAAGCSVVMKAHVAHPGTAELVAQAINKACALCDIDAGVFSLIQGQSYELSEQLVKHPSIKAVGFTGSERVGMILQAHINQRSEPIPFYGELGSVNPQFVLPNKMASESTSLAPQFVGSLMMGVGQFCTSPGIWVVIDNDDYAAFEKGVIEETSKQAAGVMLTRDIQSAYHSSMEIWQGLANVTCIAKGVKGEPHQAVAAIFSCDLDTFLSNDILHQEVFGPSALIVKCKDIAQMQQLTSLLKGNLTATIHAENSELEEAKQLANRLVHKVGRLIFNQMPTGVEVCASMNHGGPFPASTDVRTTSVGTKAIDRFRRPICYQNFPVELLPALLKN